ncbi:MAG TPA: acyltransferase family protein [Gemmatimonadaceae bacterium]|jgi:peptidoglycan/LPS O-acetylase OafA/YrhL
MTTKHRSDIDGLRAIAVIPVVLFHARMPPFSGGFVGVDVFFVISGYLITRLILADLQADRFSFATFYERRVRRIFPALFATLAVTAIIAQFLLLPEAAGDFGDALVATLFFGSNILFARRSGYFDVPGETRPLLHTWSLSVEEQFYIAYPLFLFLITRYFRRRYALAIAGALLLSFLWGVRQMDSNATAAFFLSPPRVWELLVGALLAVNVLPRVRHGITATLLGGLGLASIAYGVFGFTSATPFPGVNALFPVLGAALVIYSGSETASPFPVARLLSTRPLVFVGLISYSLYLWHWPIIVFARHYFVRRLTVLETGAAVAASVVMAVLSWKFVEQPLRERRVLASRPRLFRVSAASAAVLASFSWLVFTSNIVPHRLPSGAKIALDAKNDFWKRMNECLGYICRVGDPNVAPTFLLWGDSHGNAIAPVVEQVAQTNHIAGIIATKASCPPLLGVRRFEGRKVDCRAFGDSVVAVIQRQRISTVLLHARWAPWVELQRYKEERRQPPQITPSSDRDQNVLEFERALRATLAALQRLQVAIVIVASVPEVGINVPDVMARAAQSGREISVAPRYAEFNERQARTFDLLRRAAKDYSATIVYPHEILCTPKSCAIENRQRPLYMDDDHLNVFGAMKLAPMFQRVLGGVTAPHHAPT